MTTMNDRIEQIEARSDYALTHESLTASDYAEMAWESARDVPYLLALVREQQARLDKAGDLISDLTDSGDCWFDHHGGCQEHGYLSLKPGEACPQHDAKEWTRAALTATEGAE